MNTEQLAQFFNENPAMKDLVLSDPATFLQVLQPSLNGNKNIMKWMAETSMLFTNQDFLTRLQNQNKKIMEIDGKVQCGKTTAQLMISTYEVLVNKRTVFWVVRGLNSDHQQAISNIVNMNNEENPHSLPCFMSRQGQATICVPYEKKIPDQVKLRNFMQSKMVGIIPVLANTAQLGQLERMVRKIGADNCNFSIVIDEIDTLVAPMTRATPKRVTNLVYLKKCAHNIYGATATSFAVLFSDCDLEVGHIFNIPPHPHYVGVEDFEWDILDFKFRPKTKNEIFDDTDLLPYMDKLINDYPCGLYPMKHDGSRFHHPVILLIKNSRYTDHFDGFVDNFIGTHNTDWVVVSYWSQGITVYHHSFANRPNLSLNRRSDEKAIKSKPIRSRIGALRFEKVEIGDVLEFLRLDGRGLCHIAIIAGDLADRGINFCSNNYSIANRWHLTHVYYKPSNTSDCSTQLQSMRGCGIYNDTQKITVATYQQVKDNVLKYVDMQRKTKATFETLDDDTSSSSSILSANKIFTMKELPKAKLSNTVKCEAMMEYKTDDIKIDQENIDREWGIKNLLDAVKRNLEANEKTIVMRILHYLWNGREFVHQTKENIMRECHCQKWLDFVKWQKYGGRYMLLVPDGEKWTINPQVKDQLGELMKLT